ncbi:hypothetical protein DFA_04133 [Cavenderia fasciculata]|uniref:Uncharacterized protein n=1 Tax=Cavenderia fasciculata TaxID=261658 RepID=F4Q1D7_CACFS|nr:uncharacterized protein DFA_04133 [Cavenderia fasciculata]EGG18638.1 hypothetical protein DFA_04133 [Cavenderia fasciculata]|eukprot:XP_004366542.1 hypothetical protein DFA_04133 [Cavenderia fasciculata]
MKQSRYSSFDSTSNQVARVFIAIQFFIYYYYKKDKNVRQVNAFRDKLLNDPSSMVKACGPLLEEYDICVEDQFESQMTQYLDMMIQSGFVPADKRDEFIQQLKMITTRWIKSTITTKMNIIGYTLMTDTFLKQNLFEEKDSWSVTGLFDEMTTVLYRLATVSKQFHHNVGQVLERLDWAGQIPTQYLKGQINYGRPLCLFKQSPTTIRYDALIRTTPYHLIDDVFAKTESLTLVGAATHWSSFSGAGEEEMLKRNKDITKRLFCTFPSVGSMPNLTKLKVVGRSFKTHKQQQETGGQYLIRYLISNVGCQLEEFEIDGRISLKDMRLDINILQYLFKHQKSSLKVIRLKYFVIRKIKEVKAIQQMIEYIKKGKLPSCSLELYSGDYQKRKDSFDDQDGFKLVESFDDILKQLLNDHKGIDSEDE